MSERSLIRKNHIDRLYQLLDQLEDRVGGKQQLSDCNGRMDWPEQGIYLFFAPKETRISTDHQRITRVGTYAVSSGSSTTLWNRLIAHRGTFTGKYADGGNHRGSVFRLRVGEALIEREQMHEKFPKWGTGSSAGSEIRKQELEHERRVSDYIRDLPFLWINVNDEPGPNSDRASLEQNIIALLSNYNRESIDPRDDDWLGSHSPSHEIRTSGLWNVNHIKENYDSSFLSSLETYIERTSSV
jgi:hypothetical protein